ncbi:hypothetical protein AMELA_G00271880 [Ameiurus melas]|uniref:C-type lectin domain-containing protein n=1 Tax=Ameiurus melas TaxID=219545 RepID=A0A7J5ZN57_AMEME|nr:hypothetical protein AMELA_G00271880 [Ameiurus melas]
MHFLNSSCTCFLFWYLFLRPSEEGDYKPFICYNAGFSGAAKFIGINSPYLTWPQAQTYCRTHHTDLASSLNSSDNDMLLQYYFFCQTISPARSQIMRLQVKSDGSVFDPAVQSSILDQIKQKLEENGMLENTTVTWKVQPDGNIFHKKKDDL